MLIFQEPFIEFQTVEDYDLDLPVITFPSKYYTVGEKLQYLEGFGDETKFLYFKVVEVHNAFTEGGEQVSFVTLEKIEKEEYDKKGE